MLERELQALYTEFSRLGTERMLDSGSVLWKEGDPGDSVVLLLNGSLEIVHVPDEGEAVVLRTMDPGSLVGEIAAFDGRARSATVRAKSPCRAVIVPAVEFRRLLQRRTDILETLFWLQVDRVRSLTTQVTRTHQRAITDPLTQLYNYGFFRERLGLELHRAHLTKDMVSLAMFDIDYFKHYNDLNGHQEGNAVLVAIASLMKERGRRGDIVARYGGEEFVALLYGASRDEARRFAESVRKAIEEHDFPGAASQPKGRITMSAGVATYPLDADSEEGLIKAADINLYAAKDGGRNRVVPAEVA